MLLRSDPNRTARGAWPGARPGARGGNPPAKPASRRPRRSRGLVRGLLVAAAGAAAPPAATTAQEHAIVASRIEVSEKAASLRLELSGGESLSVDFAGGSASVNGTLLGAYRPGGAADREWRELLGRVRSLSSGPLALELRRWRPDLALGGEEGNLLAAVKGHFAGALSGAAAPNVRASGETGGRRLLRAMARSSDREALARALEDTDLESLSVLVGRDHVVPAGTSVDGGILLVDGELEIRGRVRGDVIVADGTLALADGGRIGGDARLVESRLEDSGGDVAGEVADVTEALRREELRAEERLREEVRRELGPARQYRRHVPSPSSGRVGRAVRFTFDTMVLFAFLGLFAWLVAGRARERVGVVVRAIGDRPKRCAAVGLAGGFAAGPAYLAGIAGLAITVIGLIVWVPLFPLLVAAAAFVGLVGVSHHVGAWVLGRGIRWLRWADRDPPSDGKLLGLGTLFAPFVAGEWIRVLPIAGWVGELLKIAGWIGLFAAAVTGFGAVILTRGGTRPTRWSDAFGDFGDERDDPGGWGP